MEQYHTALSDLFDQLGLPSSPEDIQQFTNEHSTLAPETKLEEAPFWTPQQAKFIRDALIEDSEWAEVIDQLNILLR